MPGQCSTRWMVAVVVSSLPATAFAHEAVFVHPWLTGAAIDLFAARFPDEAGEVQQYLAELVAGATHEDDYFEDGDHDPATIRSARHFFCPTDGAGYTSASSSYESSLVWGANANPTNHWDWQDALDRYREGNRAEAYYALGHVLHLLQDLCVPAHVHLDDHPPPNGDDFENFTWFQCTSATTCDLPLPPANVDLPNFPSTTAAWYETANATYWRALYPGDLSNHEQAAGQIATMFPLLAWSIWTAVWYVEDPPVGDLGVDFFERMPGWFYFKDLEQAAASDRVGFLPHTPELMQFGPNVNHDTMAVLMARDLIPLAVVNSARLLRLFAAKVTKLEPLPPAPILPDTKAEHCATTTGGASFAPALLLLVIGMQRRRRRERAA